MTAGGNMVVADTDVLIFVEPKHGFLKLCLELAVDRRGTLCH